MNWQLKVFIFSSILMLLSACGGSELNLTGSEDCLTGQRGCPCYGNGTCDEGLECVDNLCLKTDQADGDQEGEDDITDDGDDQVDGDNPPDGDDPEDGDLDDDEPIDGDQDETPLDGDDDSPDGDDPEDGDQDEPPIDGDDEQIDGDQDETPIDGDEDHFESETEWLVQLTESQGGLPINTEIILGDFIIAPESEAGLDCFWEMTYEDDFDRLIPGQTAHDSILILFSKESLDLTLTCDDGVNSDSDTIVLTAEDICEDIVCEINAECSPIMGYCVCPEGSVCDECPEGYILDPRTPRGCTDDPCEPDPCNGHAVECNHLLQGDFIAVCECADNYGGDNCEQCAEGYMDYPECRNNPCSPDPCNGHGQCDLTDGSCNCDDHYAGDNCEQCSGDYVAYPLCHENPCEPDPCNDHGECSLQDGSCDCDDNYGGANCNQCAPGYLDYPICRDNLCDPDPCNGHAESCNTVTGACTCAEGYDGDSCEVCADGYLSYPECYRNQCDPDPCNGHGDCNTYTGVCSCHEGWVGPHCETAEPWVDLRDIHCVLECLPDFNYGVNIWYGNATTYFASQISGPCYGRFENPSGSLEPDGRMFLDYITPNCFGTFELQVTVCNNGGRCVDSTPLEFTINEL